MNAEIKAAIDAIDPQITERITTRAECDTAIAKVQAQAIRQEQALDGSRILLRTLNLLRDNITG